MKKASDRVPVRAGNVDLNSGTYQILRVSVNSMWNPHLTAFTVTKVKMYITLTVPRALNLVKNVGDLKFTRGRMISTKKKGTVRFCCQTFLNTESLEVLFFESAVENISSLK